MAKRKTKFQKYCEKALPRCEAAVGYHIQYRENRSNNTAKVNRVTVEESLSAIVFWVDDPNSKFGKKVYEEQVICIIADGLVDE